MRGLVGDISRHAPTAGADIIEFAHRGNRCTDDGVAIPSAE